MDTPAPYHLLDEFRKLFEGQRYIHRKSTSGDFVAMHLAKAMIKQIDRVIGDLVKQVAHFKRGAGAPICIGIVGINHASAYTSYEGERAWPTDGTARYRHPVQEATEAESRLLIQAKPSFDEFLILRFRASNQAPYSFECLDLKATSLDYGAILTRISREYNRRFRNGNGGEEG
jgi:hypothetical protein